MFCSQKPLLLCIYCARPFLTTAAVCTLSAIIMCVYFHGKICPQHLQTNFPLTSLKWLFSSGPAFLFKCCHSQLHSMKFNYIKVNTTLFIPIKATACSSWPTRSTDIHTIAWRGEKTLLITKLKKQLKTTRLKTACGIGNQYINTNNNNYKKKTQANSVPQNEIIHQSRHETVHLVWQKYLLNHMKTFILLFKVKSFLLLLHPDTHRKPHYCQ